MIVVFDIETGPQPDEKLRELFNVDYTKVPNFDLIGKQFDPASVKTGNMKDEAKIRDKIDDARKKFLEAQDAAKQAAGNAEQEQFNQLKSRAALSPLTGRVLAIGIGYRSDQADIKQVQTELYYLTDLHNEAEVIQTFFDLAVDLIQNKGQFCGHNIKKFDMPFLIRRAYALGVHVPEVILNDLNQYRPNYFIDTMLVWGEPVKLDALASYFGTTRKNGDGAQFSELFFGSETQNKQSLDYLKNDVLMTYEIAQKMELLK